jgi:hypothetical protein
LRRRARDRDRVQGTSSAVRSQAHSWRRRIRWLTHDPIFGPVQCLIVLVTEEQAEIVDFTWDPGYWQHTSDA